MDIKMHANKMDAMVSQGAIVDAVKMYFSEDATTADYSDITTSGKSAMVNKMEAFTGSIAKVNGITLHQTIVDGNESASEFTFDFDMQDGSKILWHEIIRRTWNDEGKVGREEYFLA